jgi:hypothetical protein
LNEALTISLIIESSTTQWAAAQVGQAAYENLCELFVETAYGTSGRYATATADYNAQLTAGRIHSGTPPPGALAFFTSTTSAGHVMPSIGGGWAASTASSSRSTCERHRPRGLSRLVRRADGLARQLDVAVQI